MHLTGQGAALLDGEALKALASECAEAVAICEARPGGLQLRRPCSACSSALYCAPLDLSAQSASQQISSERITRHVACYSPVEAAAEEASKEEAQPWQDQNDISDFKYIRRTSVDAPEFSL